jgi:Lrp/AsnC family transcriptional regulator for asnA, asnC and gidA
MIAEKLGTSAVTVHNRLKKLKEAKLVRECVSIMPQVFDKNVTAFIQISTVPGQERNVAQLISEVPEVIKVKGTTGDFDLIVEIVARDVDELQQLVMDRIRALDNVVRTNTILLLFSVKDELSYVP